MLYSWQTRGIQYATTALTADRETLQPKIASRAEVGTEFVRLVSGDGWKKCIGTGLSGVRSTKMNFLGKMFQRKPKVRKFLVSYSFTDNYGAGFGNVDITITDKKLTIETIRGIVNLILEKNKDMGSVIILNLIELES